MKKTDLINEEIENLYGPEDPKCEDCGTHEDISPNEDGIELCPDCLFERATLEI